MSVQAWFSGDEESVAVGNTIVLPLTIHNLGDSTESYTIVPAGLTASWTTVSLANVSLFGGSQQVIEVTITPPAVSTTAAGPTAVGIRVIPMGDSDDAVVAEVTVHVEEFDDCRLVPLQPVVRARRHARFEFMVENHGNTVATCRLHLVDPSERVDGDFDPPAVGVAPGSANLVQLRARAAHGGFRRATRTLEFEIEAARQGLPPVAVPLALVQSPTIRGATVLRTLATLALIGGFLLAWFGLAKPAIEDAVSREVDARVAELQPVPGGDPTGPVTSTTIGDTPSEPTAVPSWFRLEVAAELTQIADQSYTVPEGGHFDLTDVRIENRANDRGSATLLINAETLFSWELQNVRGSTFEPRITAIRLQPGDIVTFSVRCEEIGSATNTTCTNAVNISGQTVE